MFQLSTKALKGTTIVHSKVLKPTSTVLAEWYFTYTAVFCWYVQSLAFCIWEICALHFVSVFYIIIKVGHTKICFSVVLTQCPVSLRFLGSLGFQKPTVTWETPAAEWVDEVHQSLMSFCREKKKEQCLSSHSCLIGVWCCCMCYAVQKLASPCSWYAFHVKSRAVCCSLVGPRYSGSRHMPRCRCGSGCGCCAEETGSNGWSSLLYVV